MSDKYFTAKQLSDKLQVNRTTIWRWEKSGKINSIKAGGVRRYPPDTIDKLTK